MYEAEYRSALANGGFEGFRILLLIQSKGLYGQHEDPGLEYTQDFAIRGLTALMLGDLLEDVEYQLRPYEVNPGETDRVVRECVHRLAAVLRGLRTPEPLDGAPRWLASLLSRHTGVRDAVRAAARLRAVLLAAPLRAALAECRERIAAIEVDRLRLKPVVKVIGEFYSQTTEGYGNYRMFSFLEREGAEVVPPMVTGWVTYLLYQAGAHWRARRGLEVPFREARGWQLHRLLANAMHHVGWASLLRLGELGCSRVYRWLGRALGGIAHELPAQAEVARLAHPFYNTLLRGGEGHQEVGKTLHCSRHALAHMVLSLKPFGCMPSQLSDGVQSAVLGRYPDTLFLPVETSGDGEIHALSRVQMALSQSRARAREELDAAVAATGRSLEQIRAYVAARPALRRAGYPVPRHPGVTGKAAAFVRHVGELMDERGWKR
jgi:predicted nucleotide-binding protein (sugar kinase/HSP70/actin superfamily)